MSLHDCAFVATPPSLFYSSYETIQATRLCCKRELNRERQLLHKSRVYCQHIIRMAPEFKKDVGTWNTVLHALIHRMGKEIRMRL